jgi:CheY-like chemotaxis protein/predicted regulator of Ras-like GTPase activity (Roadblock/LC7/MglB family)
VEIDMAQEWRVLVVEDDEKLKQHIASQLQKDGYRVQGVASGSEAMRLLWTEDYAVVISDQQLADTGGLDLLQWIRTYRPQVQVIMLATPDGGVSRAQALEAGVASYLEKPLDLQMLKSELRRLLQQPGFSASLDSFDLLDVIQIINMSRKSIAMVVQTGLETQGLLGFRTGELVWAEYGALRGEEAFFALAAYKNGTVTHQPWNDAVTPNVTQPLARLIMQALQYRSKYAAAQQLSGELEVVRVTSPVSNGQTTRPLNNEPALDNLLTENLDDRPFVYVADEARTEDPVTPSPPSTGTKEWWQDSTRLPAAQKPGGARRVPSEGPLSLSNGTGTNIMPSTVRKTPVGQRPDLPSWLTEQSDTQQLRPSAPDGIGQVPATPAIRPSSAEWRAVPDMRKRQSQEMQSLPVAPPSSQYGSPEWQMPQSGGISQSLPVVPPTGTLQSLSMPLKTDDVQSNGKTGMAAHAEGRPSTPPRNKDGSAARITEGTSQERTSTTAPLQPQRQFKRNYSALVAALQTLGYSLPGFVATAVVSMDGQPIAQVAVDDVDIAQLCNYFSTLLQSTMHLLRQGSWGSHKDTVISSSTHYVLLRIPGGDKAVFQVLITTKDTDPSESQRGMSNVESAIIGAL